MKKKDLEEQEDLVHKNKATKIRGKVEMTCSYCHEPFKPIFYDQKELAVPVPYLKGYTVYTCARCGSYFIPEPNARRKNIKCCPYCMNPYFEEDNLQK